jgi:organic hydroperoxide reductase OsmC/OhrA
MVNYTADIIWERGEQTFVDLGYSRAHRWRFAGGLEVPASASPHIVPLPMSDATAIDPEAAFVAALSSCHMLWFLSIAANRRFCVDRYHDAATGVMGRNAEGRLAITVVTLRPTVIFSGAQRPDWQQVLAMHTQAHHECFIASSVKSEIRCEPVQQHPE